MFKRADTHTLHTMEISYFSAKARTYFRLKGIPVKERPMSMFNLFVTTALNGEDPAMPAIRTRGGRWMQDTKAIIDHFERLHPDPLFVPRTPVQRLAAYLFELWADEAWIPVALHTRWSYPENYPSFEACIGPGLLPRAPAPLQRAVARLPSHAMKRACPAVGITEAQLPLLEAWAQQRLDLLDSHFAACDYVLGDRPSIADAALHGCMYAHLRTDPWPCANLVEPRPHLMAWIDRLTHARPGELPGAYPPDDALPETLTPIFEAIGQTYLPFFVSTAEAVKERYGGREGRLPRGVRDVPVPMEGGTYHRSGFTIHLWMLQRIQRVVQAMSETDRASAANWLAEVGAQQLLTLKIPEVRRVGLSAAWA